MSLATLIHFSRMNEVQPDARPFADVASIGFVDVMTVDPCLRTHPQRSKHLLAFCPLEPLQKSAGKISDILAS